MKKQKILFSLLIAIVMMAMCPTKMWAETITYGNVSGTTGVGSYEGPASAFDGKTSTKWCVDASSTDPYVEFQTKVDGNFAAVYVSGYSFTTANDNAQNAGRGPKNWILKAKVNSGDDWTTLDTRNSCTTIKDVNFTTYYFELPTHTTTAYSYFRLDITHDSQIMQISEFALEATTTNHSGQTATKKSTKTATCCEQGYDLMAYTNGDTYKTKFVEATGTHNYDPNTYKCTGCGAYNPAVVEYSGTDNTCEWLITKAGEMVISPQTGNSGTLYDWTRYYSQGWYDYKSYIKSVRFVGNITAQTLAYMFYGCNNLVSVDFTNLNTSYVTSTYQMFYCCNALRTINWASVNTANVVNMYQMFYGCPALTSLDLSSLNTSLVWNMSYMFCGCNTLQTLTLGENFNTAKVQNMEGMFRYCSYLTSLDLSKFNTSEVTNSIYMFDGCTNLTSLTIGNFDMQKVTSTSGMFNNTAKLTTLNLKAVPYLKDQTFNTKFTGAGVTVNYQLDDNSVIFTGTNNLPAATTAPTYTRTVAAASNWGTMVLPYESKSDANVKLYTISAVGTDLTLTSVATVAANTPCLFKKQVENATSVTMTANSTTAAPAAATPVTPAAVDGITLTGKYALTEITDNNGYIISNNSFWSIQHSKGSNKVYCAPFRAYLASQSAVSRSQMRIGDYTGTTAVQTLDAIVSGTARYFDMSGREINDLQAGMNIVMYSNGKTAKVFVNETADQTKAVNTMSHQTRSQVEPEFYSESGSIWCE